MTKYQFAQSGSDHDFECFCGTAKCTIVRNSYQLLRRGYVGENYLKVHNSSRTTSQAFEFVGCVCSIVIFSCRCANTRKTDRPPVQSTYTHTVGTGMNDFPKVPFFRPGTAKILAVGFADKEIARVLIIYDFLSVSYPPVFLRPCPSVPN